MNTTELTEYIKHYLNKDKTKSAIMLTGKWGTGKSHYIQNELIPSLQKNDKSCVVVSLYGLKTISELNNSIYFELISKKLQPKKKFTEKITNATIMVGKTVLKNIINHYNIDLSLSQKDIKNLYKSVDLSNKLIVLEDIERSSIDIIELLGYVNNLVEHDNVKVLLIANEWEILKYEEIEKITSENEPDPLWDNKDRKHTIKKYTEETLKYLTVKEKTIGDTILFEGNMQTAISQIIKSFDNNILNKFDNTVSIQNIYHIMISYDNFNLRFFIFACQKSVDIFEQIKDTKDADDNDFIQCIFFGIISYCLKLKKEKTMQWDGNENYSIELGQKDYPLFKFCFKYIEKQKLDVSQIPVAAKAFSQKQLYDKDKTKYDRELQTLFNYMSYYETEVKKAFDSILDRLKNHKNISFYDYGKIAMTLVLIKHHLDFDIESAKSSLINNLKDQGNQLKVEEIFRDVLENQSTAIKEEYANLRNEMINALNPTKEIIPGFEYSSEQVQIFYSYVSEKKEMFLEIGQFIKNFDIKQLANMFLECTPEQKFFIRETFQKIYSINLKQFFSDVPALKEFRDIIASDIKKQTEDKIQKLHYKEFIKELDNILEKLL